MNGKKWTLLELSGVGPIAAKLKRLPTGAAVYSFCPNISLPSALQGLALLEYLQDLCATPHGPNVSSALGAYEKVQLVYNSDVSFSYLKKDANILTLLDDKSFVKCLSNIMLAAQELVPPYYVGETRNLQMRVQQHIDPSSDLRTRLNTKNIDIESLILRYYLLDQDCEGFLGDEVEEGVDDEDVGDLGVNEEQEVRAMIARGLSTARYETKNPEARRKRKLIEELLSRLCRPRYIEQLGAKQIFIDE